MDARFSRRAFLTALSGITITAGGTLAACSVNESPSGQGNAADSDDVGLGSLATTTVAFDGEHQAGIDTEPQASVNLIGFNFHAGATKDDAVRLLRMWTEDSRRLCSGETPVGSLERELSKAPSRLTITCGVGEPFFDKLGLEGDKPDWLTALPAFDTDRLEQQWGQTDVVIQVCSDDRVSTTFASRHLIRSAKNYVTPYWMQQGFNNAHGALEEGTTPRNLFGFKDGTSGPRSKEEFNDAVWINEGPNWLRGGTSLVMRRIDMHLDTWEMLNRASREMVFGRDAETGAPLSGGNEFDDIDFGATDRYGLPLVDVASHTARAKAPADHPEQVIKRRPFNWDLPPDQDSWETANTGQIFLSFQKNPQLQFVPIQARLDKLDRLNEWITHVGSAVYAVFPGTDESGPEPYWGASLLN